MDCRIIIISSDRVEVREVLMLLLARTEICRAMREME
jgi:hypothetical protein